MNEQLLNELRELQQVLKSDYTDEQFKSAVTRIAELRKLYPAEVYDAAMLVGKEGLKND